MSAPKHPRDLHLDLVRGLAMLIIFIAHVPDNAWDRYIPARFGFSSAAEVFVFSSGCASALAFGSIFLRRGWRLGTARILHRIWQVYWAHVGLFLVVAVISIIATRLQLGSKDYVSELSFGMLGSDGLAAIVGLMTLSYIPDLLNILPMYIVLLAAVPLVMAMAAVSRHAVAVCVLGLWLAVQVTGFNLPAGGSPARDWFFDPFAWQLIFFTGFGFSLGWLPRPPLNHPVLLPLGIVLLIVAIPINFWAFTDIFPLLRNVRDWLVPNGIVATTQLQSLRYLHFLVLAYMVASLLARWPEVPGHPMLRPIVVIGQQSLATFMASIAMAWAVGIVLDAVGRDTVSLAAANILGLIALYATALCVAWFKSTPWSGVSIQSDRPNVAVG